MYRTPLHSEVELIQDQLIPFLRGSHFSDIRLLRIGLALSALIIHCIFLCTRLYCIQLLLVLYGSVGIVIFGTYLLSSSFQNRKDTKSLRLGALQVVDCYVVDKLNHTLITQVADMRIAVDCYNIPLSDIEVNKTPLLLCRLDTNDLFLVPKTKI